MIYLTDAPHSRLRGQGLCMEVKQVSREYLVERLTANGRNQLYSVAWQPSYTRVEAYCIALNIKPDHVGGIGFHIPNASYPIILRAGDCIYYPPKIAVIGVGEKILNDQFEYFCEMKFKHPE